MVPGIYRQIRGGCQSILVFLPGIRLDFQAWNGYIFITYTSLCFPILQTAAGEAMPRSGGKNPSFAGQYNRHIDEMRSLMRTLDPRLAAEDEGSLTAAMDIYETDRDLVLEFDLPGLCPENISLVQHGMVCVIQAEKVSEPPREQVRYLCLERHFGRLRRTVRLPDQVDPTHIRAEYCRGVLRIICPKGRERRILIKELTRE